MVSIEEVKKVAGLAKLEFGEDELESLTSELNNVLGYIDQLKEVDVSGIAPLENMNEAVEKSALRTDAVRPSLSSQEALKNAPKAADNYFLVPKVLAQEVKTYVEQDIVGDEEDELL